MSNNLVKKNTELKIIEEEKVDWLKEANDLANNKIVRLARDVVIGFLKRKRQNEGENNGKLN